MYRIHEIKLDIDDSWDIIPKKIVKKLKVRNLKIDEYKVVKESIDARDKKVIKKSYTVDFSCNKKLDLPEAPNMSYQYVSCKYDKSKRPVIVGFGPCGMFCALILAQMGYKPIVLERGRDVDKRTCDVEKFWQTGKLDESSNVQFGEGGAGTFSDGKLTTGIKDKRIRKVLEEFVKFGAPDDILYKHKAHIGTDILKIVVKNIREEIKRLGGDVRFSSLANNIITKDNKLIGLEVKSENGQYILDCEKAVFAIGHSARDTFNMLYENGLDMNQKPFSIGVRIEHPQKIINEAQYGSDEIAQKLGAADYKLSYRCKNGRGVYTFCMCPGGVVVMASSSEGQVVTNGMSYRARNGQFANSGLLVDVRLDDFKSDHPLAGVAFQEKYERMAYEVAKGYHFPICTWENFKNSDVARALPEFAVEAICEAIPNMGKKLKGFDMKDAKMKGVETRSSSPVRFSRDKNMQSNIKGIYPAGEGAGYAGGIVSAAVDGIKIAESIAEDKEYE